VRALKGGVKAGERARRASRRAVSTIRGFSLISLRDLLVASGPTIVLVAVACFIAYLVVDPAPPRQVRLATGQENSAYETFGQQYAKELKRDDIVVGVQRSLGSKENLERLQRGEADIAFVQSGSTSEEQVAQGELVSLGSLFTEPVWLFLRENVKAKSLTGLRGLRINLGPEGTGVPNLFRQVLAVNGIEPAELTLGALENTPATVELLAGRIDGLVFSSAPEAPLIQMLLQTPGIRLFNFDQAEAYTRRLPFLTHVVLPRGIVDLGRDIPAQDYHLIAPTATLVAREDLHPALIDLFVKAAGKIHGGAGWFQQQGQFPSPKYTEIPVAPEAAKYYRDGPPLLQRYSELLAGQPVRPPVGRGGGAGRAGDSAVEDRAAAVRVAGALARLPLVRRTARGRAGGRERARGPKALRARGPGAPPGRHRDPREPHLDPAGLCGRAVPAAQPHRVRARTGAHHARWRGRRRRARRITWLSNLPE